MEHDIIARKKNGLSEREKPMQRSVYTVCGEIIYELTRKRVKNINLRVHRDGKVCASAGARVSAESIDALIASKAAWIIKAQIQTRSRKQEAAPLPREQVSCLAERFAVVVLKGKRNSAEEKNEVLFVTLRDPEDLMSYQRMVAHWQEERVKRELLAICREAYPAFAARGVAYPQIRFRKMTSRWGSCMPAKGSITLNLCLAQKPRECAEYVVYHDFAHFLVPNHSKAFYAILTELLPDWKARRKRLAED